MLKSTSLPATARVWVYLANRVLTPSEVAQAKQVLDAFIPTWNAHGTPLDAEGSILYEALLVLAVDETEHSASGCSIDSSVRIVKQLEQELGVSFFNRQLLGLFINERLEILTLPQAKQAYQEGRIQNNTLTLNTLCTTKSELETQGLIPLEHTWAFRVVHG